MRLAASVFGHDAPLDHVARSFSEEMCTAKVHEHIAEVVGKEERGEDVARGIDGLPDGELTLAEDGVLDEVLHLQEIISLPVDPHLRCHFPSAVIAFHLKALETAALVVADVELFADGLLQHVERHVALLYSPFRHHHLALVGGSRCIFFVPTDSDILTLIDQLVTLSHTVGSHLCKTGHTVMLVVSHFYRSGKEAIADDGDVRHPPLMHPCHFVVVGMQHIKQKTLHTFRKYNCADYFCKISQ